MSIHENLDYRCGFAAIIGKPNVGKSTLMNAFMQTKLAIVTPKPQTTRKSIMGIISSETAQLVFVDTPGWLEPRYKLQEKMKRYIETALADADVLLAVFDVSSTFTPYDEQILAIVQQAAKPSFILLNKCETVSAEALQQFQMHFEDFEDGQIFPVSALENQGIEPLLKKIEAALPLSPPLYDPEYISTQSSRFHAEEIIRERLFLFLENEVPYSTAVEITQFHEEPERYHLLANIYVERSSQKAIVLGKNGEMIKKIRRSAEYELKKFFDIKVKLELWVKVRKKWRKHESELRFLGY